jgi:hypothetical protein
VDQKKLRIAIVGRSTTLSRIEAALTRALQQFLTPRHFEIVPYELNHNFQKHEKLAALLEGGKDLQGEEAILHRAASFGRVALEEDPMLELALRIDSSNVHPRLSAGERAYYDDQYAVVAALVARMKGAPGPMLIYSSTFTMGYLGETGLAQHQEEDMYEPVIGAVVSRWRRDYVRGVLRA